MIYKNDGGPPLNFSSAIVPWFCSVFKRKGSAGRWLEIEWFTMKIRFGEEGAGPSSASLGSGSLGAL